MFFEQAAKLVGKNVRLLLDEIQEEMDTSDIRIRATQADLGTHTLQPHVQYRVLFARCEPSSNVLGTLDRLRHRLPQRVQDHLTQMSIDLDRHGRCDYTVNVSFKYDPAADYQEAAD